MKFLLVGINAKYIHSNPAIYSLKAYAGEELGQYVELVEYTINQQPEEILADIYRRKPEVIGFSCYIWNWDIVGKLLDDLPKLLPDTEIWLGGPEVSYDADRILKRYPALTGIMVGEGEATFRELLEYYVNREKRNSEEVFKDSTALECISGLCLRTGYTASRTLIDMSTLPFLYDDLTPFENRIRYYETSRGCPYRCSYCLSSIDKTVRLRDIDVVKRELQLFLDSRVKQVKFIDRTFNCNHEHAMAIWQYIYEHDNGVTNFHFEISADILREDEIALLNRFRPGLAQLEIGVQTVNPVTLKTINRVMDVGRLEKIVDAIQRGKNVHQHLDLIAGLPYEDYNSFSESFNRVYRMKPEQLQLGFLKVLKGPEMREKAEEYEICYTENPPYEVLYTKWLSYEEVRKLKQIEEMVELYYNSGQFTRTLPVLEKAFKSPFVMYERLAEFYEKHRFFVNSPARAYRYHVLLEFAEEYDSNQLPVYRELLTYDMYLREKVKSRPDFAVDINGYREEINNFYRKEEKERRYLPDYEGFDWKQLSRVTHMEPFQRILSGYVLFDYSSRNPLNHEAAVQVIQLPQNEKVNAAVTAE